MKQGLCLVLVKVSTKIKLKLPFDVMRTLE